jgi:hypothetical protein
LTLTPGSQYFVSAYGVLTTVKQQVGPLVSNFTITLNLLVGTATDAHTLLVDNIIF